MWPMAYAGFAVTGVGLIVGAVTGGMSLTDAKKAKMSCDEETGACNELAREPLARSRTLAHVSTTGFVIAGVGAAVGVIGLVLALGEESDGEDAPEDVDVDAGWLPGGGYASLRVRF
jgi:F0F1-type ATP synthase membrane subunit c/vacuolar-type H+-ATPase subunit K